MGGVSHEFTSINMCSLFDAYIYKVACIRLFKFFVILRLTDHTLANRTSPNEITNRDEE